MRLICSGSLQPDPKAVEHPAPATSTEAVNAEAVGYRSSRMIALCAL